MDSIKAEPPVTIELEGEAVKLRYGMAALYYLTKKYGDINSVFKMFQGKIAISPEFIERLADIIYAGLWNPDDEGNDTSGWSTFRLMHLLSFNEIEGYMAIVKKALEAALPKPKNDPSRPAPARAKKAGTGTTSTPQPTSNLE